MANDIIRQPTIGILGGTSHVITSAYYQGLNAAMRQRLGGTHVAETLVRGMDFGRIGKLVLAEDWDALKSYVGSAVDDLERGGADLVIGSSNTVHEIMGEVMEGRDVAFLPISTPLIDAVKASGLKRVAMFGTRSTMNNGLVMREVEAATGATLLSPREDEREEINRVIFEELCEEQFLPRSRDRYVEIARRLARDEGAEGVILGCTEIMLLIDQDNIPEMKVFPTGRLHIEAAANWAAQHAERED
ncbi:amino acid racemase [Parvularcula sp. ZS-1/3]|uniref:Amino acid racemase n=1 Tax=Parvularcula mediterranea TaxID=2732508 RepID=A0A7Y3RN81_9PROT|nr:amino acid racemase [Parvularcula mediterranea]NNU17174.1 amino acid racemase [Parvularcula mediterranea]